MDKAEPAAAGAYHRLPGGDRRRIPVQGDDLGTCIEDGGRVTAGTERAIENNFARSGFKSC